MERIETDVAVIGAGTAGLAAYRAAKAAGKRAVLIESGPYGTTCARVGCMPSKLLIAPAEAAHTLDRLPAFGMALDGELRIDGRAVMARVQRERDRFVGFVTRGVDEIPEADKIAGHATFVDDHTLSVGEERAVHAKAIVIATGSTPNFPPVWKGLGDRLITNDQVFELPDLPKSVAVFGPGVIGLELGQALHRLGVRVKVFGRGGGIGAIGDPAILAEARKPSSASEIYLDTDAHADVQREGDEVVVRFQGLDGVRPRRALRLPARRDRSHPERPSSRAREHDARPATSTRSRSSIARRCSAARRRSSSPATSTTTCPCCTRPPTRAASPATTRPASRRCAAVCAARSSRSCSPTRRSRWSATAGAPRSRSTHVVGVVSFEDQGRARVMLRNKGLLHVYAEVGTGRFLGAEMIGPDAEHIAHLLSWALQLGCTIAQMLEMPFYHPVVEEGLRTALRDAQAKLDAAASPVRRVA